MKFSVATQPFRSIAVIQFMAVQWTRPGIRPPNMRLIRHLFLAFRRRQAAPTGGYGAEVLFAGWVELPASFRELAARRAANTARNRSLSA
jgi:hypothetical protein